MYGSLNQTLLLDGAPMAVREFYNTIPFPFDVFVYFLHITLSGILLVAALLGVGFVLFWTVVSIYETVRGRRVDWGVFSIVLAIGIGLLIGLYATSSGLVTTYGS